MLRFLRRLVGREADPVAYRVALDWFEQQLAEDLLGSGLHWVWESHRGFKAVQASLPETRPMTVLTAATAREFGAEIGEYYLEAHREVTAFATAGPVALSAAELRAAIGKFALTGTGPLVAILYQPPQGASEVFLPRAAGPVLEGLLTTWAGRLGKPVREIERAAGGEMLERLFLKGEAKMGGFPPPPD